MSDRSSDKNPERPSEKLVRSQNDLDELRDLIIGPFQAQLGELQRRMDTPQLRAKDVSSVLPEAISLRSSEDKKIEMALEPITENAIKSSIKKDRQVLVNALFPVMGPAIRKAISSAIQSMIQGFNKLLENSISAKGLKWRLEALRTGKTFAEVVFLHTLEYQVEQLFLINRDSGLVLQHVVANTVVSQDPELVSGMLTAIKDFVQDSFGIEKEASLDTLRVGDRNVWIEHGPHAFLAAVIRGDPPVDFQLTLREALEEIHFKHSDNLANFEGDASVFEKTKYILDTCLQAQLKTEQKKGFPFIWIAVVLILGLLLLWPVSAYRQHHKLSHLITTLQQEPGIVVTSFNKVDGSHQIIGLRDPLAADPDNIIQESGLDSESITSRWELYHSSHPKFMIPRIKRIINPPPSVHIRYENGVLHTTGSAPSVWIQKAREVMDALPWIETSQFDDVVDIDKELMPPETVQLKLQGTTLMVLGDAPQRWIREMKDKSRSLPGISDIGISKLVNTDLVALEATVKRVEESALFFKVGSNQLEKGELDKLQVIVADIKKIITKAQLLDMKCRIKVIGHADASGSKENNLKIRRERAEGLISLFQRYGLAPELFDAIAAGSAYAVGDKSSQANKTLHRRVNFQIIQIEESS